MKKIMFNEPYGLQKAVLDKRKTMTRRVVSQRLLDEADLMRMRELILEKDYLMSVSPYKVGEVIAIAQRYSDLPEEFLYESDDMLKISQPQLEKGWNNKMFVKAELMQHHIRITNVKVEYLQDITEEDCLREGIQEYFPYIDRDPNDRLRTFQYFKNGKIWYRRSPATECFAKLIDDISGKGTWDSNPLVYAYEFELID